GQDEPTVLEHLVSGNYFSVLGVHPILGRLLGDDDDRTPGAHSVAVISYGYWSRRFGGDPAVIGKTISLAGAPFTIIGVTPPEFFGAEVGSSPEIYAPVMMAPQFIDAPPGSRSILEADNYRIFTVFGRLKPGVTQAQAVAGLDAPFRQVRDALAKLFVGGKPWAAEEISRETLTVTSFIGGLSPFRQKVSQSLLILIIAVVLLLLNASANRSTRLLAPASARQGVVSGR